MPNVYETRLQLVNHVLRTLKTNISLREEDLDPDGGNETGAFIAIELNKTIDKALWLKTWRFTTEVFFATLLTKNGNGAVPFSKFPKYTVRFIISEVLF